MTKKQLYKLISTVAGLVGIGMIFGHSLGNGTTNTAVWIGGMLILAAAVIFGMFLSINDHAKQTKADICDDQ